jgi:E3 ubiquitin-protein ligase HUWE1
VAELINKLSETPNEDLHEVLGQIDSWKWPRSDLNAWIRVLNKFDAILEEVIQDYDIDKLQVNVFTPTTKKTVSEILRFERLLLENSTNRKTYASYDVRTCVLLFLFLNSPYSLFPSASIVFCLRPISTSLYSR